MRKTYAFFWIGGGFLGFVFTFIMVVLRLGLMYPRLFLHSFCSPEWLWISDLFLLPLLKFWSYRSIVQIIPGPYVAGSQTQGFVHQVKHSTNWATSWALSFAFHKTEFHYTSQTGFKPVILLSQPSKCQG